MNAPEFLKAIGLDRDHKRWVELRFLAENKPPIARFYPSVDKVDFREVHRRNGKGYGVYFGVGLRRTQSGKQEDVASISCLWTDVDGKDFDRDDPERGKQLALEHLRASLPSHLQPTIIIDSGHGYHLYWVLMEPCELDNSKVVDRVKAILKGLAAHLRGDKVVAEIARVMRLPETFNQKFDVPVRCQVIEANTDRKFNLLDFEEYEEVSQPEQPQRTQARQNGSSRQRKVARLSRKTLEYLVGGADDGVRNNRHFIAACDMKGCGWEQEEAENKLLPSAMECGLAEHEARSTIRSAFSKERSAARPDGSPGRAFDTLIAELDGLKDSAITVIQEQAWQWVGDVSAWSETDVGRFTDRLSQAGLTPAWIKNWQKVVKNTRRRSSKEPAQGSSRSDNEYRNDPENHLPMINITDRRLRDISADTLAALKESNDPPKLFIRGNRLVDVLLDERQQAGIRNLDVPALLGRAERVANFVKQRNVGGEKIAIPVPPTEIVVNDILSLGTWTEFPLLQGIVTAPIFAPDGTLELLPGYLPRAQVFYHSEVPLDIGDTTPTSENVTYALNMLLGELLVDFPFADPASRAHTLALILTPFARPLIKGPTPHIHIGSPIEGSGKTLLAEVCIEIFDPTGARILTIAKFAEEMRKRVTSVLSSGPSHVLIDNLQGLVDSAEMAAVFTARTWSDRLLGKTSMLHLPVRCVWISTGNNVRFSGELARRTVTIRLDARVEQPWERQGFRHPLLREWACENRGSLITACLTLVRCWLEQGRPLSKERLGSFESWSQVMGGIMDAIGVDDFLGNRDAAYLHVISERQVVGAFVRAWYEAHQNQPVGVSDLFPIASMHEVMGEDGIPVSHGQDMLGSELGEGNARSRQIRLGKLLSEKTDRVYDSLRIVPAGTSRNAAQFRLEEVEVNSG